MGRGIIQFCHRTASLGFSPFSRRFLVLCSFEIHSITVAHAYFLYATGSPVAFPLFVPHCSIRALYSLCLPKGQMPLPFSD